MLTYINAGFGEPLSRDDLSLIKSLGYAGVRQDIPNARVAPALVDNILSADLRGIFVIPVESEAVCQEAAHAVSARAAYLGLAGLSQVVVLEVGNEEDLPGKRWSRDPLGWAKMVADVAFIARSHSHELTVVSGGCPRCPGTRWAGWSGRE